MQILKKDLFEILNGNQELINQYKTKYFPKPKHTYTCKECGRKFETVNDRCRIFCSPKCVQKYHSKNSDKNYMREYKKMYARMKSGKISCEDFQNHMIEYRNMPDGQRKN